METAESNVGPPAVTRFALLLGLGFGFVLGLGATTLFFFVVIAAAYRFIGAVG